jgi:hypothetical protein
MRIVNATCRLLWHVQRDTLSDPFGKRLRDIAISHSPDGQKAPAGFVPAWNPVFFEYRHTETTLGELFGCNQPGGSSANDEGIIAHRWHCWSPTAH